jgi:hypothetical protein
MLCLVFFVLSTFLHTDSRWGLLTGGKGYATPRASGFGDPVKHGDTVTTNGGLLKQRDIYQGR